MTIALAPEAGQQAEPLSDDRPAQDARPLTAALAHRRAIACSADSADAALFEAVAAQAHAAHAVVAAVSGTARRATTPTSNDLMPHAETAQEAPTSSVTATGWPGAVHTDPADWLAGQLHRFSHGDQVDPYAELMLRRAGFAPAPR